MQRFVRRNAPDRSVCTANATFFAANAAQAKRNRPETVPTRPGAQYRCFSKGFQLKTVAFWMPGRFRLGPALEIDAFLKHFN